MLVLLSLEPVLALELELALTLELELVLVLELAVVLELLAVPFSLLSFLPSPHSFPHCDCYFRWISHHDAQYHWK